jgi:hypothetical protein
MLQAGWSGAIFDGLGKTIPRRSGCRWRGHACRARFLEQRARLQLYRRPAVPGDHPAAADRAGRRVLYQRHGDAAYPERCRNTYAKTITDRLGIFVEETDTRIDQVHAGTLSGWQNFDMSLKYLTILDLPHEFLFTLGLDREFGDTGARRVGASPSGATTPQVFFGKGLGDLDIGYLRPLAVTGFAGYSAADSRPRPDLAVGGLTVQYSIPYLESKVESFDLPDFIRGLTPMTEFIFSTPTGKSFGERTTALFGPGVSYAGEGWELAIEALVPASRATGRGVGVTAQLHISLDFLAPDTIGKPLFSSP